MDEPPEARTDSNSLLRAVYLSRLRLTRLLLEGGAYINESNEHGETPLMIACKTRHTDPQSVPKIKMVRYLLESGADPNIQDKTGKTALIHACLEQSRSEVLLLLLSSGADPTLEDHAGLSALLYAVGLGNQEVLNVLLDACKVRGKEVIIIPSNKMPPGQQKTKQYFNVPPPPDLEEHLHHTPASCCMSPHEAQMQNSLGTRSFHFGESTEVTSQPGSPTQRLSPSRGSGVDKQLYLHRMPSELGFKSPTQLHHQKQVASSPEEELSLRSPAPCGRPPAVSRHHSIDVQDTAGLQKALENMSVAENRGGRRAFGRKMSCDGAATSLHSASHPSLHRDSLPVPNGSGSVDEDRLKQLNIEERHHYSSNFPERQKLFHSRPSTLFGSKESLDRSVQQQGPAGLERRGSGAFLLDHIAHTRPGYLPPLNPHAPIPDIGFSSGFSYPLSGSKKTLSGLLTSSKPALHQDLKAKRILWRRHSMHSEQIQQLCHFQETSGLTE